MSRICSQICAWTTRVSSRGFDYYSTVPKSRRVVVTGLGLVTPVGVGVKTAWGNLLRGCCGIAQITNPGYEDMPAKIAGFVPRGTQDGELDEGYWFSILDKRYTSQESLYAFVAASEAMKDCGWTPKTEDEKAKAGVSVGIGMSGLEETLRTGKILSEKGYRKVSPFLVPKILCNTAAGLISINFQLQGPNHAVSTACAAGAHAIGDAFRFIRNGDADIMVAGGTEACITPFALAGFCKARALTTKFNDRPEIASRPFDKDRSGFVIGEGAGILVLEEMEHAIKRGANIYAEFLGYGSSGDAHHITAPSEDGRGASLAMQAALRDAGCKTSDVCHINTHATSTPLGDAVENKAIKSLFGNDAKKLKISSTKGATGHLLGAAGAVEAVFTILSVQNGIAPATLNLQEVECKKEFDLNYVPQTPQELEHTANNRRVALSNSFGFGGTNTSLCVCQFL